MSFSQKEPVFKVGRGCVAANEMVKVENNFPQRSTKICDSSGSSSSEETAKSLDFGIVKFSEQQLNC